MTVLPAMADRPLELLLGGSASFEQQLTLLLMTERQIVIPDILFFNCLGVRQHILEHERRHHGMSLLSHALVTGRVIVASRQPAVRTFEEILNAVKDPELSSAVETGLHPTSD